MNNLNEDKKLQYFTSPRTDNEYTCLEEKALPGMADSHLDQRGIVPAVRILLARKAILERQAQAETTAGGKEKGAKRKASQKIGVLQLEDPDFEYMAINEAQPQSLSKAGRQKEIAQIAGVERNDVIRFEYIQSKKPELIDAVCSGVISINEAYKQVHRQEKKAQREARQQENAEKVERLATPLEAQGLFQTIVIDPPWDWGDEGDVNQLGRARPDYKTMPLEEIKALPINRIADENCHLYLWVTNRSLPKAFELLEAWGFRYITCLTWVKPSIGMGNYFRGSTEQVLFAIKGSMPLKRRDVGTHFEAPRGKAHSAKPDAFYRLVESCSYGPCIDIFGRKERDGWSVWGENG